MSVTLQDKWLFVGAIMADPKLPGAAKFAAYFMLDHLNTKTERCDPSLIGLAEQMGMSERSVVTGIEELIEQGYFERISRGGGGVTTKYRACWKRLKQTAVIGEKRLKQSVKKTEVSRKKRLKQASHETGNRNREETGKENPPSEDSNLAPPEAAEKPTPARKKYAFTGKIVRLTQADFDQWEKSFRHIDLRGALQSRDDWLAELPKNDRRRSSSGWYRPTSNWLASRNEQAATQVRHDDAESDTIY